MWSHVIVGVSECAKIMVLDFACICVHKHVASPVVWAFRHLVFSCALWSCRLFVASFGIVLAGKCFGTERHSFCGVRTLLTRNFLLVVFHADRFVTWSWDLWNVILMREVCDRDVWIETTPIFKIETSAGFWCSELTSAHLSGGLCDWNLIYRSRFL